MGLLTRQLLNDLGIELQEQDYQALSDHFDSTLQDRVINEVAKELDEDKAHQLANMKEVSDDDLIRWLQDNVQNFSEIVSGEVDILLGELAEGSEVIRSK